MLPINLCMCLCILLEIYLSGLEKLMGKSFEQNDSLCVVNGKAIIVL